MIGGGIGIIGGGPGRGGPGTLSDTIADRRRRPANKSPHKWSGRATNGGDGGDMPLPMLEVMVEMLVRSSESLDGGPAGNRC